MKKILLLLIAALLFVTACNNDQAKEPEANDRERIKDTETDNTDPSEPDGTDTDKDNGTTDSDSTDTDTENPDTDSNQTTDPNDESDAPETDTGGSYSSSDAVRLVEEYLQADGLSMEMNYRYDGDDDRGHYRIHVFEVVDNGDGASHTSTLNWYFVDPETGTITKLFTD